VWKKRTEPDQLPCKEIDLKENPEKNILDNVKIAC